MEYKFNNGKVITRAVEYTIANHCNLRCVGCSHMSPFLRHHFPSVSIFQSDIEQLSNVLHAGEIRLIGGEPLLNKEINEFLKVAKKVKIADRVVVSSNGLLLHKMDDVFWEYVDCVYLTLYPNITFDKQQLGHAKKCSEESNTDLFCGDSPIFRQAILTQAQPMDTITDKIFESCRNVHIDHCHMIHEGMLYKCPVPPFLPEYLKRLGKSDYNPMKDAFDIHNIKNKYSEIKSFLLSKQPTQACRYCLGFLGKTFTHRQLNLDELLNPSLQSISRESQLDYKLYRKIA